MYRFIWSKRKDNTGQYSVELALDCDQYCPMLWYITWSCWATSDMNFISWNKAYSLYPRSTFIRRETSLLNIHIHKDHGDYIKELRELLEWGWTHVGQLDDNLKGSIERFVGEPNSWVVPCNVAEVTHSKIPDTVLELSKFWSDFEPWPLKQADPFWPRAPRPQNPLLPGQYPEAYDIKLGPFHLYSGIGIGTFQHPVLKHIYGVPDYKCAWE